VKRTKHQRGLGRRERERNLAGAFAVDLGPEEDAQALWDAVFEITAPARNEAVRRGRIAMAK